MAGISERYRRMAEVYRVFARGWEHVLDFSERALEEMNEHESRGGGVSDKNGYAVGKRYLNVQVAAWREDIQGGLLTKHELYADERFPRWWLDSVLGDVVSGPHALLTKKGAA